MAKRDIDLVSISNVVKGQQFEVQIPVGSLTYDIINLSLTNISFSDITELQVRVDSRTIWDIGNATVLDMINKRYGRPTIANMLSFYFQRPELTDRVQRALTSIGSLDLQTFTITGKLKSTVNNPKISGHTTVSEPTQIGFVNKIKHYQHDVVTTGRQDIGGIALGPRVQAIHFMKADIDRMSIEDGSIVIYEGSIADNNALDKAWGRIPQTDVFTVDFSREGDMADYLVTAEKGKDGVTRAKALRFLPDVSSKGNIDIFVEFLDAPRGL